MRAVVCREFGPPEHLVLGERKVPVAGLGQVVLDVRAVGVNFVDTLYLDRRKGSSRKPAPPAFVRGSFRGHRAKTAPAPPDEEKRQAHRTTPEPFGGSSHSITRGIQGRFDHGPAGGARPGAAHRALRGAVYRLACQSSFRKLP